jgi:hypothetical protein
MKSKSLSHAVTIFLKKLMVTPGLFVNGFFNKLFTMIVFRKKLSNEYSFQFLIPHQQRKDQFIFYPLKRQTTVDPIFSNYL